MKNYRKQLTERYAKLVTCGIFYCRDSASFSVSASNKLSVNRSAQIDGIVYLLFRIRKTEAGTYIPVH